jgi:hypothetical protein
MTSQVRVGTCSLWRGGAGRGRERGARAALNLPISVPPASGRRGRQWAPCVCETFADTVSCFAPFTECRWPFAPLFGRRLRVDGSSGQFSDPDGTRDSVLPAD